MTRSIIQFIVCATALLLPAGAAWAQSRIVATVPFDFQVPGGHLPAGTYEITAGTSSNAHLAIFRNTDTSGTNAIALANPFTSGPGQSDQPHLLFQCPEQSCYLTQMWTGTPGEGLQFLHKSSDRGLARVTILAKKR